MPNKAHSYNDRYRLLKQTQLEKITEKELSVSLREKINDAFEHIYDNESHITQEEREKWNRMDDLKTVQKQGLLFTAEEKKKLNNIEANANNYVHPKYNTMDPTKTYIELTVNADGHVVFANNPSRLNVDASESLLLNGNDTSFYLKSADPVLEEAPIVTTATNNDNKYAQVNVKYMKDHCITSSYYVSDSLEVVKNKIRIDSNSDMWYYNETRGWCQLNKSSIIELDSNGKIKESYFRTKMSPYPIGIVIPVLSVSRYVINNLSNLGFIQLDGSELKREDYPELWSYINNPDNGCYIVSENDWQNYNNYFNACGFFSSGDGSTTFRLPSLINVEPRQYKTTDDSIALGAVYEDTYPSEDATGFTPNNMQSFKRSAFYYPILGYNISSMYDSSRQDESNHNFIIETNSLFDNYKDSFKGVFQPGFPSADTIFSLYGNPYMTKAHTNTTISLLKNKKTDQVDDEGEPIYTNEPYNQINQNDEPLYSYTNDDQLKLNNEVYKQTTDNIYPIEKSTKTSTLADLGAKIQITFSEGEYYTNSYYLAATKLCTPGNIYNGKYIFGEKISNTNYKYYFFNNLNKITTKYLYAELDTDEYGHYNSGKSGSKNLYYFTTKTDFENFIANGDKLLLKINNKYTLKRIISKTLSTTTAGVFNLTFVCVESDGLNVAYSTIIQPMVFLSPEGRKDLNNKLDSFDESTQGLVIRLISKNEFVIDGFDSLTSETEISPSKYNICEPDNYNNFITNDKNFDTYSFTYITEKSLAGTAPALPQVIKFNNGSSGNEFNYNYLKTSYYIKAK